MKRIVTFPRFGEYTALFRDYLKELGLRVLVPPQTSEDTIKWGCKHSSDMMCFPYKVTLGNFKEALEKGANALVMWDNKGQCRLRHYWVLHEHALKEKKYNFDVYPVKFNFPFVIKRLNPRLSYLKIIKLTMKYLKKLKEMDRQEFAGGINIGLIGEVYTCLEPAVNNDIINKIKSLGANVYNTVTLYGFLRDEIKSLLHINFSKWKYKKKARKYLNGPLGGHGFENVYNLLWLIDHKIDGVVHLLPLSCMPESTVEPIINFICRKNNIPLLRLPIDETNSETNVNTRVEAFVELIKRRRKHG